MGLEEERSYPMISPAVPSPVGEVVEFFAGAPSREEIAAFRLSPTAHECIRTLLARHAAGALTLEEEREIDQMVLLDDILSLIRARVQDMPSAIEWRDRTLRHRRRTSRRGRRRNRPRSNRAQSDGSMNRRGQFDTLSDGRKVLLDDNTTPTLTFLWAAVRTKGQDVQYNHVWTVTFGDRWRKNVDDRWRQSRCDLVVAASWAYRL